MAGEFAFEVCVSSQDKTTIVIGSWHWSGLVPSLLLMVGGHRYMHHPSPNMSISLRITALLHIFLSPIFDAITPSFLLFSSPSSSINLALKNVGTEVVGSDNMTKVLQLLSFDNRHQLPLAPTRLLSRKST